MGKTDDWWVFTGSRIEEVAAGLDLPVNLAFVPRPHASSGHPGDYVAFAYGETNLKTERSG